MGRYRVALGDGAIEHSEEEERWRGGDIRNSHGVDVRRANIQPIRKLYSEMH